MLAAEWRSSGLTGWDFARRAGVSEGSLRWWKWHLACEALDRASKKAGRDVAPLTFVVVTSAVAREPFEIVLTTGVPVRVPSDFDATAVGRLLEVLERRR